MAAMAEDQGLQLQVLAWECARREDQVFDVAELASEVQYLGGAHAWRLIKPLNRLRGRLSKPGKGGQATALYIGVNSLSFDPVFSAGPTKFQGKPVKLSFGDDFKSIQFRSKPSNKLTGCPDTILHEYMLTPGALGFTKRIASDDAATVQRVRQEIIDGACKTQLDDFEAGFPMEPLRDAENDVRVPIRLAICKEFLTGAYTLRLPRIRRATVTKALVDLALIIQKHLDCDNIHINEIIIAMFVFLDHEDHQWLRIEPRYLTKKNELNDKGNKNQVSALQMLSFISMFPHYLRMHEQYKLVTYMHPYRFVHATRTVTDMEKTSGALPYNNKELVEMARSEICRSGLTDEDWVCVLPSSLLGSQRQRQIDADAFAEPSEELHQDLALPDINMIGHPVYPISKSDITSIIIPARWLNPVIPSEEIEIMHQATMTTSANVLDCSGYEGGGASGPMRLISGRVLVVHSHPEAITSLEPPELPRDPVDTQELQNSMDAESIGELLLDGVPLEKKIGRFFTNMIRRDIVRKLALVRAANLTEHDLSQDVQPAAVVQGDEQPHDQAHGDSAQQNAHD